MWSSMSSAALIFGLFTLGACQQNADVGKPAPHFRCPEPDGTFPDEVFCDKYYQCENDRALEFDCPDGLFFSFNANRPGANCDDPFNIDCGNRTELQDPKPSGDCPRRNGRFEFPDPAVCDRYIECRHGDANILACAPGLHFGIEVGQCTWPNEAKRTGCGKKKNKLPDGFECPDEDQSAGAAAGPKNPNPTYAHPKECGLFYVCIGGTEPRLNRCSADLVFNNVTKTCDTWENVPECAPQYEDTV